MKCPNCNETDHEPTAKYCHVCGALLVRDEVFREIERPRGTSKHKERGEKVDLQNVFYWIIAVVLMTMGVIFVAFVIYLFVRQFL